MNAPEAGKLYSTKQVVEWLQHKRPWFYRRRKDLRREGFPSPVSKVGQPRWRGEDLLAWAARDKTVITEGGNVTVLAVVAKARSAAMAGRRRA